MPNPPRREFGGPLRVPNDMVERWTRRVAQFGIGRTSTPVQSNSAASTTPLTSADLLAQMQGYIVEPMAQRERLEAQRHESQLAELVREYTERYVRSAYTAPSLTFNVTTPRRTSARPPQLTDPFDLLTYFIDESTPMPHTYTPSAPQFTLIVAPTIQSRALVALRAHNEPDAATVIMTHIGYFSIHPRYRESIQNQLQRSLADHYRGTTWNSPLTLNSYYNGNRKAWAGRVVRAETPEERAAAFADCGSDGLLSGGTYDEITLTRHEMLAALRLLAFLKREFIGHDTVNHIRAHTNPVEGRQETLLLISHLDFAQLDAMAATAAEVHFRGLSENYRVGYANAPATEQLVATIRSRPRAGLQVPYGRITAEVQQALDRDMVSPLDVSLPSAPTARRAVANRLVGIYMTRLLRLMGPAAKQLTRDEITRFRQEAAHILANQGIHGNCGHNGPWFTYHRVISSRDGHTASSICTHCLEEGRDDGTIVTLADGSDAYEYCAVYDEDDDEYRLASSDSGSLMGYSVDVVSQLGRSDVESSPTGDFTLGIEVETVSSGASGSLRKALKALGSGYAIAKQDGSLPDDGVEFVTKPALMTEHVKRWTEANIAQFGFRAWGHESCGTHIHIDSRAFTSLSLGKFLQFFNNRDNAAFLRKVAGRHPSRDGQAEHYADYDFNEDKAKTPHAALEGKSNNPSRYTMVNLCNLSPERAEELGLDSGVSDTTSRSHDTVEVRLYKASLNLLRLCSQIEFTHAAVVYCRTASHSDMSHEAFTKWLRTNGGPYPNLCKFLTIRPKHGRVLKDARVTSDSVSSN